jgi:hypothetical protein
MIEREGWNFRLICDHCEDYKDGFEEFEDAVSYKKRNGWKSVRGRTGWFEFCPRCSTPEIMSEYRDK